MINLHDFEPSATGRGRSNLPYEGYDDSRKSTQVRTRGSTEGRWRKGQRRTRPQREDS